MGGKGQYYITKSVSQPGVPGAPDNWNTDFSVGGRASRYVATIRAKNKGDYRVAMYLKYPNNSSDKVFDQTVSFRDNQSFSVTGVPRTNQTPYQVNVFVGGTLVVGNSYRLAASACY